MKKGDELSQDNQNQPGSTLSPESSKIAEWQAVPVQELDLKPQSILKQAGNKSKDGKPNSVRFVEIDHS